MCAQSSNDTNILLICRITCMDERQDEITSVQRKALLHKAYEFETINLERVQKLKSFSANLNDETWNNLTTANVCLCFYQLMLKSIVTKCPFTIN